MAISVTDIGHNSNASGTTVTITGVTVPAGAMIFCFASEAQSAIGSFTDTVNAYTKLGLLNGQTNPIAQASYVPVASSLSGGTITYTRGGSAGDSAAISALYATGLSGVPLDSAVTAAASGNASAPSLTSGTPSVAGELFIAVHSNSGSSSTADPNWSAPPDTDTANNTHVYGGNQINAGFGTKSYNPTGNQTRWNAAIYGFEPLFLGADIMVGAQMMMLP